MIGNINTKLDQLATCKAVHSVLDRIYLFLFGFLFLDAFYRTSLFPQTYVVNQWLPTLILLALILVKLFLYGRNTPIRTMLCGVLAMSVLTIYKTTRDINLPIMAYLVIGACGVSFNKILSVYTAVGAPFLVICIAASQFGVIPDLIDAGRGIRHSFGIIFPTDFAAHVTFLVLAWGGMRGKRLTWPELGVFALFAWAVKYFCDARTSFISLLVFTALCACTKLYDRYGNALKSRLRKVLQTVWTALQLLASNSIVILSALMVVLTWSYSDSAFSQTLDRLFSGRLMLGKWAFEDYGIPLLGQEVVMQGLGYSETQELGYYFYIDCSYIKMLICYGLLASVVIWVAYMLLGRRAVKDGNIWLVWMLGVIGLHCTMEHHLMEIAYNPFLLALFAHWECSCKGEPCRQSAISFLTRKSRAANPER